MKIITNLGGARHSVSLRRGSIVSVGVFDGVHIGHNRIISRQVRSARRLGLPSVVVTFDPHPLNVLEPKNAPSSLISLSHRMRLFEELGVDAALVVNFTRSLSRLSPEAFVRKYLVEGLNAKLVVVGPGFFFGRYRDGDIYFLKKLGDKYGFDVVEVKPVMRDGVAVSSTHIRRLIGEGMLREAEGFLGRPVSVLGTVKRGSELGGLLGYPTANVDPHHEVVPPPGVYAVKVKYKNRMYGGVLNIGRKPTVRLRPSTHSTNSGLAGSGLRSPQAVRCDKFREPSIEVHIFGFEKKIYGEDLRIDFVKKLRRERKFPSLAALSRQIKKDIARARSILKGLKV